VFSSLNKKDPEHIGAKGRLSACQRGWPPPRGATADLTGGKALPVCVARMVAAIYLSTEDVWTDIFLRYLAVGEAFDLDRSSDWNLVISEPLIHRLRGDIYGFG